MAPHKRNWRVKALALFVFLPLLILSACGSSGGGGTVNGTTPSKGTVTVGGKKDVEAQLLTEMYSLLLRHAGYTVNEKLAFGNTPFNVAAIKNGDIDLYPEFTATGLNVLGIASTYDPQKDYQAVKNGFEQQYKITWLDPAPLNDGYAICTSKSQSQSLGITTISQLAPKVSQMILESPSDGISFVDNLQKTYGFSTKSFKKTQTVDYAIGFSAVQANQAQFNVCYGTDASVPQQNFIFLQDDKNGFPAFNPAPIVRDAVLTAHPDIATILNPLAPDLTTDVSIMLQQQVATKKASGMSVSEAVKEVATTFLQSKGLM
jgi:osmoprotectant transport system substrate-binding protein